MSRTIPKKNAPVLVQRLPWTFQRMFDKWLLPVIFVAIGSLMVWAVWRG